METLVWFLVTVVGFAAIELWRVLTGRITISVQIRELNRLWPSLGFLSALVAGLLLSHFFLGVDAPGGGAVIGVLVALGFGLIGGTIWFR